VIRRVVDSGRTDVARRSLIASPVDYWRFIVRPLREGFSQTDNARPASTLARSHNPRGRAPVLDLRQSTPHTCTAALFRGGGRPSQCPTTGPEQEAFETDSIDQAGSIVGSTAASSQAATSKVSANSATAPAGASEVKPEWTIEKRSHLAIEEETTEIGKICHATKDTKDTNKSSPQTKSLHRPLLASGYRKGERGHQFTVLF
jgi:hypothetical protein